MKYNIDGKYPMMANWLTFKKIEDDLYKVENGVTDRVLILDELEVRFLRALDGNKNPLKIGKELNIDAENVLAFFEEEFLVRDGRTISLDEMTLRTVYIPRKQTSKSVFPKIYNMLLLLSFIPVLVFGIYEVVTKGVNWYADYMGGQAFLFSMVLGLVFHEISHAMASLAYGGKFFEAGFIWQGFCPGAYAMIDAGNVKSRFKRIQIDAAGIEMDCLLAGVFLVLAARCEVYSLFWLLGAVNNLFLSIFNLAFTEGLDGSSMICEVLGIKDSSEIKRIFAKILLEKNWKRETKNRGAILCTCIVLMIYKILMPVLLVHNILIIIDTIIG
jgi:hypothetical protein